MGCSNKWVAATKPLCVAAPCSRVVRDRPSGLPAVHALGYCANKSAHACYRLLTAGLSILGWACCRTTSCPLTAARLLVFPLSFDSMTHCWICVCCQGIAKLREPTALVRVRQCDLMLAKEILEPARKQYAATYGKESPTLTLDQRDFLPPPPSGGADDGDEYSSW